MLLFNPLFMKKTISLFYTVILVGLSLLAQQPFYSIQENSFEKVKIQFSTPDLQVFTKNIEGMFYSFLRMDGFFSSSITGCPQLPILSKTIEIPLCEDIQIEIISTSYSIYSAEELGVYDEVYPAQKSYAKSYDGHVDFFKSATVYQNNEFYGESLAKVEKIGEIGRAHV